MVVDGCSIKPSLSVKLLGVTLDHHLSFSDHINNVTKKCHGIIGVLARASHSLPRELLRLAYIVLVRSHMEYSSENFSTVLKSQLKKLDIIQKISARVICLAPRDAHAAPLLQSLKLDSLESRRNFHIISIVRSILSGNCHPSLRHMFSIAPNGLVTNNEISIKRMGQRRFRNSAREIFNAALQFPSVSSAAPLV